MDSEWKGGKKDQRLWARVRAGKQKVLREKYERLKPSLDERNKRLWIANEAIAFGKGGVRAVAEALKVSPQTVMARKRELESKRKWALGVVQQERQRQPGGGRKSLVQQQPGLIEALEFIVDPATRGDPMTPLKWTSKSLVRIRAELRQQGFQASTTVISKMLREDLK